MSARKKIKKSAPGGCGASGSNRRWVDNLTWARCRDESANKNKNKNKKHTKHTKHTTQHDSDGRRYNNNSASPMEEFACWFPIGGVCDVFVGLRRMDVSRARKLPDRNKPEGFCPQWTCIVCRKQQ
mmetsp:Transcript_6343/g.18089  ORF Transcript_6343/g.18089 Transcript_6343/m.18089 type:complete len:126 (+) Transcript_6343:412-789(+)